MRVNYGLHIHNCKPTFAHPYIFPRRVASRAFGLLLEGADGPRKGGREVWMGRSEVLG